MDRAPRIYLILAIGTILLIIFIAFTLVTGEQPLPDFLAAPGVLLATASLSLLIISFFVGVFGVLGWQGIARHAEYLVEKNFHDVEERILARALGLNRFVAGVLFLEQAFKYTNNDIIVADPDSLELAIEYTDEAYESLKTTDYDWKVRNNLAFLLSFSPEREACERAWRLATQLRKEYSTRNPDIVNTYATVLANVSSRLDKDVDIEISRTIEDLNDLIEKKRTQQLQKEQAQRHLKRLRRALPSVENES